MKTVRPRAEQPSLFECTGTKQPAENRNIAGFSDPSFAVNKSSAIHRWVPWIAGFSKDFVSEAIARHLRKPGVVLDPFAGVGTTLVEAILSGHEAVGFEINPYAALACKAKISACSVDPSLFQEAIEMFRTFYSETVTSAYKPKSGPPPGFNTRTEFFSPKVMRKVLIIQDYIRGSLSGRVKDLFELAFAATMVSYSNYSYEPSLSRRSSAGKDDVLDYAVGEAICCRLAEMVQDIKWFARTMDGRTPRARIWNDSYFRCREMISAGSIDLVVTSPPYLNNYHYNRNTRPQLYWLDFARSPRDFVPLEEHNFGKYWQTVRDTDRIDLNFPNPDSDIIDCIDSIRKQNPNKGVYGGGGWANYAASYFNDCYRFAALLRWSLKRRGTALVVIGNNILQGIAVPTDRFLAKIAAGAGLEPVAIHIPRETRVGNSIIQSTVRVAKAGKSRRLYEAVVELRKR